MAKTHRIALMGFLPWTDPQRGIAVQENPAAVVAEACARELSRDGLDCAFVPVPVSDEGILGATTIVRTLGADIIVALGQTSTEPRVETLGRVPCSSAPVCAGETSPWTLATDADQLVPLLNALAEPTANAAPFRTSDDAGGYFCDHLCVELARDATTRGTRARFVHITATDGVPSDVRAARLRQYQRQARATVEWLLRPGALA